MAIVRNPANTVRRGRIGETTYYVSGGQQVARQARNSSNYGIEARRSEAQQSRRVLWANLVSFYKASAGWMSKAFETRARNQTDYNKFMQVNISTSRVALTKNMANAGAVVIDAYIVSQGSLPSISVTQVGEAYASSISVGSLVINDNTTVADFSEAVLASNAYIADHSQISFVSYQQTQDALGIPRAVCRLYEVTLNSRSQDYLRDFLPEFCSSVVEGKLGTSTNISLGGFAYILSSVVNGTIKVSTQQLVSTNEAMVEEYSSDSAVADAMASYGVDSNVVLSPDSIVSQEPEDQPIYIASVVIGSKRYLPNNYFGRMNELAGKSIAFTLSARPKSVPSSAVGYYSSYSVTLTSTLASDGKVISGTVSESESHQNVCTGVGLILADGTKLSLVFSSSESNNTGMGTDL